MFSSGQLSHCESAPTTRSAWYALISKGVMDSEGSVDGGKQENESTDQHDGDSVCGGTQLAPTQPYTSANQSTTPTSFPLFVELPWELRRLVWQLALPRTVFMSTILEPANCVPYPSMGLACREAHLVAKEYGSVVTAWNKAQVNRCWEISWRPENRGITWPEEVPSEADMCLRTWVSSKLDTLVLDSDDDMVPYWREEHERCEFVGIIGIGQSPTTRLVVYNRFSSCVAGDLDYLYQTHLRNRREILLCVESFNLRFSGQARDIFGLDLSWKPGSNTQVVRLDDVVALKTCLRWSSQAARYSKWETEKLELCANRALRESQGDGNCTKMEEYKAWMVEDQVYEGRLVSPQVHFLLKFVDNIMSSHPSIRSTGEGSRCRGHEVMDDTGRLKQDHPLVRELDIKLPLVIPAFTVSFAWHSDA
ncbi:hypothetical protein DHEL01_v210252 [Diaporthe helianthi]|uniref:2EXR domain-containing protein n=1 Tax=Diaporthe helianthi TaxID=158607 RepID=A0A2P5HM59_DIAHE|nr:hypothetical protein DHEL01_v210252 [Diaporthe helianthi]